MLCIVDESLHIELRSRVTCELVLHFTHYLKEEVISAYDPLINTSSKSIRNTLVVTSPSFSLATPDKCLAEEVFQMECLETPIIGSFSAMWHVHALASVLKRQVLSIYPDFNHRIQPAYNKLIYP